MSYPKDVAPRNAPPNSDTKSSLESLGEPKGAGVSGDDVGLKGRLSRLNGC